LCQQIETLKRKKEKMVVPLCNTYAKVTGTFIWTKYYH